MKTITLRTVIKNYSEYQRDFVWENAQDLEHVGRLHPNTNHYFEIMHAGKKPGSKYEYDSMAYRTIRKEKVFFKFHTFGYREIIEDYNLRQVEFIPFLGMTSALNSLLYVNDDPKYPTLMVDELVLTMPAWMGFLKKRFLRSMHQHAAIQCQEDEPLRARRSLLKDRRIDIPFRLLSIPTWDQLTGQFEYSVANPPS